MSQSNYDPKGKRTIVNLLTDPFRKFTEIEATSSLVLLSMTVLALVWANSPWGHIYEHLKHFPIGFSIGDMEVKMGLEHWINDGLMAIFFFVVGMEIKREMVMGELSSRSKAMFPVLGALGGMIVPAGIYYSIHRHTPAAHGWGIPMATDIAFAIAALTIFGKRVPIGLKIFLLALAIADDLGAVAVIAVFYTNEISFMALGGAAGIFALTYLSNVSGIRSFYYYTVIGAIGWLFMHASGVHATIAGVIIGFLTPTNALKINEGLEDHARNALRTLLDSAVNIEQKGPDPHTRHQLVRQVHAVSQHAISPLDFLTNQLHGWVAFLIMPVFALANAGVVLDTETLGHPLAVRTAFAVSLGLLLGKPIGITLAAWLGVKLGVAQLPKGVNWVTVAATGVLAGIGFTVALFVTALAFDDQTLVAGAKVGILIGSFLATMIGMGLLWVALPKDAGGS